ncbi:MAG: bifunctional phosphoribosylaminoimidazolecarboxamide formyltransferase/IMP cyclohydrolase PurH, partial [Bacteroidetes bacterium]|nr:bifunctional phosphoribosylaminoimidazolecarboxamide formyltransferase/IMP cyclohydrolase PurH [Bacteroidota bacterium]
EVGAAQEINKLFFEVLVAPNYQEEALEILKGKKKRILLRQKGRMKGKKQFKSLLNGVIEQDRDSKTDEESDFKIVTSKGPTKDQKQAMLFASKIAKHTKSNTIVLAKQDQMIANGVGQTSRVDALKQSIEKAKAFGFDLNEVIMASDAFFPFPDCVEIANKEGIKAVIQPGGSIRDQESIDFCNKHGMAMATTGFRHFKH